MSICLPSNGKGDLIIIPLAELKHLELKDKELICSLRSEEKEFKASFEDNKTRDIWYSNIVTQWNDYLRKDKKHFISLGKDLIVPQEWVTSIEAKSDGSSKYLITISWRDDNGKYSSFIYSTYGEKAKDERMDSFMSKVNVFQNG